MSDGIITDKQNYAIRCIKVINPKAIFNGKTKKDASEFINKFIDDYYEYKSRRHYYSDDYVRHNDDNYRRHHSHDYEIPNYDDYSEQYYLDGYGDMF